MVWPCAHFTALHETKMNEFRMRRKIISVLQRHSNFILYTSVFSVESK